MLNDKDAINALIYENVNITEANPLKDLAKVAFQLIIYIVIVYFSIFYLTGVFIQNLSIAQQQWLENAISNNSCVKTIKISQEEEEHLISIKKEILATDLDFPKTSALDIKIIKHPEKNALCYANGNIYITDTLYKHLTNDEMLTFVIAHEMAHYKNKDHLMQLRKNIASNVLILSFAFSGKEITNVHSLVSSSLELTDMKYSRKKEALADTYAGKILKNIYGDISSGIQVLKILNEENYLDNLDILSTHPSLEKRISNLELLDHQY